MQIRAWQDNTFAHNCVVRTERLMSTWIIEKLQCDMQGKECCMNEMKGIARKLRTAIIEAGKPMFDVELARLPESKLKQTFALTLNRMLERGPQPKVRIVYDE